MQNSNSRSTRRKQRIRRLFATLIVITLMITAVVFGIKKAYASHQKWFSSQPIICIEDSYGKVHNLYNVYDSIEITGPVRIWSPRFGIGAQESSWHYAHYQTQGTKMQLATQGGSYIIFLQPCGWNSVDRDLKNCVGQILIDLR